MRKHLHFLILGCCVWTGCTVKAVGDPNRPITINAHVVVDIRGLEKTATNIEDYVSGEKPSLETKNTKEGSK